MSCCQNIQPPSNRAVSADVDEPAPSNEIRPGESMDCFMDRCGNTTGLMDDKTDYPEDKIVTADIPLLDNGGIGPDENGLQFEMTPGSNTDGLIWSMTPIDGLSLTQDGKLTGKFDEKYFNRSVAVEISVNRDGSEVDARTYNLSPSVASQDDSISFIHPLPGGVVTSKFGPRKPPTSGASSQHGGVDFAIPGGKTIDVLAAADGTVIFTGYQARGAGNYIKISHKNKQGKDMCTTVYMHLAKIYVSVGQTVIQGQKIGLEGNTGVGTGAHLHFECRLPNGTKIDPMPLINGDLKVFRETNPDNTGKSGTDTAQNSKAVLTPSNVDARAGNCPKYGESYPKDPECRDTAEPDKTEAEADPFIYAWTFIMKHEVGPFWDQSQAEVDPDIINGSISTAAQRRKVGYVNDPKDPGGKTKFGVAQKSNPSVDVETLTYKQAENIGYNNYWSRGNNKPKTLSETKPKTAGMLFDINYVNGVGGGNTIFNNAGITDSMSDDESLQRLYVARSDYFKNIVKNNPSRSRFINGWLKRADESLSYFKAYTKGTT